jgi:serine phosphatase RsbU (regulator of sigma subunit)
MELKISVSKTNKYAVSESGDSVEITERPQGGMSVIMADAQGSGKSARTNSKLVVSRAASLIGEGARDGAVARAVHDMMFALRDGRVSATLTIISADLVTRSVVVCQNGGPPVFVLNDGVAMVFPASAPPIGVHRNMKPNICEFPMEQGLAILAMTDGIYAAGRYRGNPVSDEDFMGLLETLGDNPTFLADHVLEQCVARDEGRPGDDMSVMALYIGPGDQPIRVRKMSVLLPC